MKQSIVLIIVAFNEQGEIAMRLTLSSPRPYEAVLQEAMGMGRRFIVSKTGIVRVEVYDEARPLGDEPIAVVTRDDVFHEDRRDAPDGHFYAVVQAIRRLFWHSKALQIPPENPLRRNYQREMRCATEPPLMSS